MAIGRKHWLKKVVANCPAHPGIRNWGAIKLVAVIVDADDTEWLTTIGEFSARWKTEGKQVHILRISKLSMNKKKESLREHNTLYSNETNWKGIPVSSEFNEFVSRHYDAVLHLCKTNEGVTEFIPFLLHTDIMVGASERPFECFDLTVKTEGRSNEDVLTDIEHWLKKIQNVA